MKDRALYLEATREGERLKIGIRESDDTLPLPSVIPYEAKTISVSQMEIIEQKCLETVEFLNIKGRTGRGTSRLAPQLKKMGRMLANELLTISVKEILANSDAKYLILSIDDNMVQIPWEHICLNDEFLCERFCMGRIVKTRQDLSPVRPQPLSKPINMWLVTNPGRDLPSADIEGTLILRVTDETNPEDQTLINAAMDSSDITSEMIKTKIQQQDIVHFAGHAEYDPTDTSRCGWKLGSEFFSVKHIDDLSGKVKMPTLVFSNACQSACTEKWQAGHDSFGLANAFLRAGVSYYVGTFWEILDKPSTHFAREFYTLFLSGKSIGEAVHEARLILKQKYFEDYVGWAGYLLYGDPRYQLPDIAEHRRPLVNQEPAAPLFDVKAACESNETITVRGSNGQLSQQGALALFLSTMARPAGFVALFLILLSLSASLFFAFYFNSTAKSKAKEKALQLQAKQQEKLRNDALIENISKKVDPIDLKGTNETDALDKLPVSVVYNSYDPKTAIIASALKKDLKNAYPALAFVERQELNALLEEANLSLSLPTKSRPKLNLLASRLILRLSIDDSNSDGYVTLNLLDAQTWENLYQETCPLIKRNHVEHSVIQAITTVLSSRL